MNDIAKIRRLKGISQSDLAKQIGISRTYLSFIENNQKEATDEIKNKLAEALDVDTKMLFYGVNEKIDLTEKIIKSLIVATKKKIVNWSIMSEIYPDESNLFSFSSEAYITKVYNDYYILDEDLYLIKDKDLNELDDEIMLNYVLAENVLYFYLLGKLLNTIEETQNEIKQDALLSSLNDLTKLIDNDDNKDK